MAQHCGTAGQSVRELANKRHIISIVLFGLAILIPLLWINNINNIAKLGLPGVIFLIIIGKLGMEILGKKALYAKKRARDADRGAEAEEKVAERLNALPDGYFGFHDISFDGFNVDHIVVGPGGIFVVETKSHRGKLTARGDALLLNNKPPMKDFLNQAWSQTFEVRDLLKEHLSKELPVKPVLCFSRAFVQVRRPVKGIAVTNIKYLNDYLLKQRRVLDEEDLKLVVEFLRFRILRELPPEGGLVKATTFKDFG
jgi:hypothetical protein